METPYFLRETLQYFSVRCHIRMDNFLINRSLRCAHQADVNIQFLLFPARIVLQKTFLLLLPALFVLHI